MKIYKIQTGSRGEPWSLTAYKRREKANKDAQLFMSTCWIRQLYILHMVHRFKKYQFNSLIFKGLSSPFERLLKPLFVFCLIYFIFHINLIWMNRYLILLYISPQNWIRGSNLASYNFRLFELFRFVMVVIKYIRYG